MAPVQSRVEVTPIRQRSNGGIVSSTTITRSRVLRSAGLIVAPLMLLGLAGCGDDDDSGGDSAGGDKEAFCDGINDISNQADEFAANADSTPDELMTQLGQLVDRMHELDPPAEIADDWNQTVDVLDTMASGDVEDLNNFEATDEQNDASDRVSEFMVDECGVDENSLFGTN
jgi:hypothetical protein